MNLLFLGDVFCFFDWYCDFKIYNEIKIKYRVKKMDLLIFLN